jgi:hypothetical protein
MKRETLLAECSDFPNKKHLATVLIPFKTQAILLPDRGKSLTTASFFLERRLIRNGER